MKSNNRKIKPKNIPRITSKGEEINHVNLPIRIAVLIDGGFFIKRFNHNWNREKRMTPDDVANHLYTLAHSHVGNENYLYGLKNSKF